MKALFALFCLSLLSLQAFASHSITRCRGEGSTTFIAGRSATTQIEGGQIEFVSVPLNNEKPGYQDVEVKVTEYKLISQNPGNDPEFEEWDDTYTVRINLTKKTGNVEIDRDLDDKVFTCEFDGYYRR